MPIHHAVLALLTERPAHGYELKTSFERAIGPQWGDLNIGHLYQVLERLVRDDFVRYRVVRQADRPDKHIYRITTKGRAELEEWLLSPFVGNVGYRDDVFLKLFAASRLGSDRLLEAVKIQRDAYLAELGALGELRSRHRDDPLVSLLIQAAELHTRANLKLTELARDRALLIVEATSASANRDDSDTEAEREYQQPQRGKSFKRRDQAG
jgi:DNA-binding PadR family transcriptional regulator